MDCKLLVNKLKPTVELVNGKVMDQQRLKNLHSNGLHVRNYEATAAETMKQCNINDMENSQKNNFLLFHQLNALQPYALNRFPPLDAMHFVSETQSLQNANLQKDLQNAHSNLDENRTRKIVTTEDCMPSNNLRISPTLSETSTNKNTNWSAEEQFKQVRQLYEINDDPKRKEFLDELFSFMQKRGTPISRLPIMAKSVLDLYELYNLVIARGGLVDVINKKLWQEIIKGLHLPSSITSAAFTLRTQYMRFLYPYECEKKNLSTPAELQAAVDSNRREGRRSNYYQSPADGPLYVNSLQQMAPFMNPNLTQLHGMPKPMVEERLMQYLNLRQAIDEYYLARSAAAPPPPAPPTALTAPALTSPALTPAIPTTNVLLPVAGVENGRQTPVNDASNQALDLTKIPRSPIKRENSLDEQHTDAPPNKRTALESMPPFNMPVPACDKNLNQSERVEAFLNFIKAWQESQLQLIRGS